jgi:hypothetical protein
MQAADWLGGPVLGPCCMQHGTVGMQHGLSHARTASAHHMLQHRRMLHSTVPDTHTQHSPPEATLQASFQAMQPASPACTVTDTHPPNTHTYTHSHTATAQACSRPSSR